jgi:hypothetical protein
VWRIEVARSDRPARPDDNALKYLLGRDHPQSVLERQAVAANLLRSDAQFVRGILRAQVAIEHPAREGRAGNNGR